MRTLAITLLALATADAVFAQTLAGPSGKFYGPLVTGAWATKTPLALGQRVLPKVLPRMVAPPQPAASPCSVPLLEAQVRKGVEFTIGEIHPRAEQLAPTPPARVPAPSCESQTPR
jgi:hypothetical protein